MSLEIEPNENNKLIAKIYGDDKKDIFIREPQFNFDALHPAG